MRYALFVTVLLVSPTCFAQSISQPQSGLTANQPQSSTPSPQAQTKGCLAVKSVGSHAFRNIMLAGVAGAFVSKEQFQVVDAVDYPARIGQKFHGSDLQTMASSGTKVAILEKHYNSDDLHKACH